MQCFHWRPTLRLCIFIRSVAKVGGSGTKIKKGGKFWGRLQLHDRMGNIQACLDLEADLPWGRDVFYKTGLEIIRASHKPLTDKPYEVPTGRTDKQTGLEKHTYPTTRLEVGIIITVFDDFLGKK